MLQPKVIDWLDGYKNKTCTYAVYKRPTSDLETHTKWKWKMEKGISWKWKLKESWSSSTHIGKIDFKINSVTREKEIHYVMIKGSIQEDITIVNMYASNTTAPQYIRQMLTDIKGDIESNTIIMGDCNTPLTSMDRSSRQKISKETQVLNDTLDQKDLIDIYRTFHSKAAEYIFFSSAHGTFSRIDHILGHRASLSKFKKIKITSSIFSDHNTIGLEINYKKRNCKKRKHKHMEAKQYATKQPMDHWRNQRGNLKIPRDKWQRKHDDLKPMWCSKSSPKKEVYSNTILPQETRKISNKQPNLTH